MKRKVRMAFSADDDLTIYHLWHAGAAIREICDAIAHPRGSIEKRIGTLRDRGVSLPYRREENAARFNIRSAPVRPAPINDYVGPKFCDDPRARGDHGSSAATLSRPITYSSSGSSAAWAAQG